MISLRRMTLGSGYRYLMESVAVGDGAPGHPSNLTRYYATSGTPPGVFLGAGLAGLDDGRGVEVGSQVTEQHLFNLLGMCADPITGQPLGRQPNRAHLSLSKRVAERVAAIAGDPHRCRAGRADGPDRGRGTGQGRHLPHAGGRVRPDLLARPSRSRSPGRWPTRRPRRVIYACHRRAIEVVLDLRRARGVPLAFGHQRRGARRHRRSRGRGLHPLGFAGRGSPAPRPRGGGQPGPLRLRRHLADARFSGACSSPWSLSPSCTRACCPTC